MRLSEHERGGGFVGETGTDAVLDKVLETDLETLEAFRLASQGRRFRILRALRPQDRYPSEIAETLDIPKSRVHGHLERLKEAELVTVRAPEGSGPWRYHRLTAEGTQMVRALEAVLARWRGEPSSRGPR